MGSIIAAWSGQCPRERQPEFLELFEHLAKANEQYWLEYPEPLNPFNRLLHQQRSAGLPPLEITRRFDTEIRGRILLNSDVLDRRPTTIYELTATGLKFNAESKRPRHGMFEFECARLTGIDFRLFDAFGLYPGDDRLSFVLLDAPDRPALDGRMVQVHTAERCRMAHDPEVAGADAYLECPFIHLRNHHVAWLDMMVGWMKHFYMPELNYQRGGDELDTTAGQSYAFLEERDGRSQALSDSFHELCEAFLNECTKSVIAASSIDQ